MAGSPSSTCARKRPNRRPRPCALRPILSLAHTNQVVPKAAEFVKLMRKRAEAYRTNQLLVLLGDDFKWSQAWLYLLLLYLLWPHLLWLHLLWRDLLWRDLL